MQKSHTFAQRDFLVKKKYGNMSWYAQKKKEKF